MNIIAQWKYMRRNQFKNILKLKYNISDALWNEVNKYLKILLKTNKAIIIKEELFNFKLSTEVMNWFGQPFKMFNINNSSKLELFAGGKSAKKLHHILFEQDVDPERIKIINEAINSFPENQDKYIINLEM